MKHLDRFPDVEESPVVTRNAPDAGITQSRRSFIRCMAGAAVSALATPTDADAGSHDPEQEPIREQVDLIEVNRYYDELGKLILSQYIFYDWCSSTGRYQVRDWKLIKECPEKPENTHVLPQRRPNGELSIRIHDGDVRREITARFVRHTHTQYDPELLEREFLPKERRRELRKKAPTRMQLDELLRTLEANNGNP